MSPRTLVLSGLLSVGLLLAARPAFAGNSEPTIVTNSARKVTDSKGTTFYATWIANDPVGTVKPEFFYTINGQTEKQVFAKPGPIKGTRPIKVSARVAEVTSAVAFEWRAFAGGGNNGNNDSTTVPDKGPDLANPLPGFPSPALSAPGIYLGIVKDTGGGQVGFCKVTLSGTRVLSGVITYIDGIFHFSDPLGDDARLTARVSAKGHFGLGPTTSVNLDATFLSVAATNRITLALADPGGGAVGTATLVPTNPTFTTKNPSLLAGRYTVLLPIDPAHAGDSAFPQGEGYATIVVAPTGSVKLIGKLADGAKLSVGSTLDEADGVSLFVPLYHGTGGFLAGKLDFAHVAGTSDAAGKLHWQKPGPTGKLRPYDAGFSTDVPAIAARYTPPLSSFARTIYLLSPDLTKAATNVVAFLPANRFAASVLSTDNQQLTLRLDAKTGVVSGVFNGAALDLGIKVPIAGVVFQEQNRIGAFCLGFGGLRSGLLTTDDLLTSTLHAASGLPVSIPDNDPTGVTSTIAIVQAGSVVSCRLSLAATHTYGFDLTATLISPAGTSYALPHLSYFGDSLSLRSPNPAVMDFPIDNVVGEAATGNWTLKVVDSLSADVGTLDSWSLKLITQ